MEKLHFLVVCTFGAGSSLMLKMNVERLLKSMGVTNATVEVSDMGGAKGRSDITAYLCSTVLRDNLAAQNADGCVLGIRNCYDNNELKAALSPFISEQ